MAERRLREFLGKAQSLQLGKGRAPFGAVVDEYRHTVLASKDLKSTSLRDSEQRLKMLLQRWPGLELKQLGDISRSDCERWFAGRKMATGAHRSAAPDC